MPENRLAVLLVVAATALPALGAAQSAPENAGILGCEGAFAKDSSHAKLVEVFGKSNVAFVEVESEEGNKTMASVVYPDETRRRVEVLWHDEKARRRPAQISVGFRSTWRTVRGLHIGTELAEVEKLNGKPFKLSGFDWDLGGRVLNWNGGTLAKIPGGCVFSLGFNPWADAPGTERDKVSGDKEFSSADPNMRASKPTVSDIILSYPE